MTKIAKENLREMLLEKLSHHFDDRYEQDPYAEEISPEEMVDVFLPIAEKIWDDAVDLAKKEQEQTKPNIGNASGGRRYRDPKRR